MGIFPLIHKLDAIRSLKEPRCSKDIRSLMGSINHFNKFIRNLVSLSAPFRELMQKNIQLNWSEVQVAAFEKIKKKSTIMTNHHFDVNLNTRV